jgi:putative sterol carrier protein
MSDIVAAAVEALNAKLDGEGIDGSVKLVIEDEGAVRLDADGASAADAAAEADCTLSADADTFRAIIDGALDPTSAFMSGRLRVEGDMGLAMKLGSILA